MAYSGNEISFMDYTKGKRYNDYGTYNYGSAAYEIDFEKRRKEEQRIALEEEKRRKHAVRVKNERRLNILRSVQLIAASGVFFFGCVLTITAVSSVTEMRYRITELKEELITIQNENIVLASEISDTINLDYIEERAVNDLGMTEPQEYQIKTISVPEQSYTVQYNESKNEMPEVNAELLKEFFFKSN